MRWRASAKPGPSPIEELDTLEIYEGLLRRVGFDPASPTWTAELIRLHEHSRTRRLQVLMDHFYTPLLDPATLPESVWTGRFDAGAEWNVEKQMAFFEEVHQFAEELAGFPQQPAASGPPVYHWDNGEFSHHDAVLYYSLLRARRPRRVVEVGGGFSTLLASAAAERNATTQIVCVEPYPRPFLAAGLPRVELHASPVQDVPLSLFDGLGEGDVLFYDGSHVSKTGSDVNHVLLRILPRLAPGVFVHVHDIFLPFEYPKEWLEQRLYWNEQYVLAALLSDSRKLEILAGNYFLVREAPGRLYRIAVPGVALRSGGASLWMRTLS
ncbi:MAG TPA: class I SAM-dependent methyltransferase [Thermoanaerobaculia bacterium]